MKFIPRNTPICCTLLLAAAFAPTALAGQADICYGPTQSANNSTLPTNSTVFSCPQAGNKTLPQLAADGWQVVQLVPVTVSTANPTNILIADQLVIQK
ncbi:MAG TPA: hypothetical protein VM555_04820 [Tahibacter sp.]|jgi:hypothetical protein|nr:hypothetical protein [Tahibacter sp.]